MATEALSSAAVTNATAVPRVPNSSFDSGGSVRTSRGSVTVTSGTTTGSTYDLVRVPSNARVISVKWNSPAGSASSAFNVGVYQTSAGALSTVVDADLFASALACTNAVVDTDITGESTVYTNAKREQELWEAAGMSADPGEDLAIVATNTATNAAAFAIAIEVTWTL
jgi:hypothetical protein